MNKKTNIIRSAYIVYFLIAVFFVAIRIVSSFGYFNALGGWADIVFTLIVQVGILFCGSVFLFGKLTKKNKEDVYKFYNVEKISSKCVLICIGLGIIVFILNIFASTFFQAIIQFFGYVPKTTSTNLTEYPFWLLILNIILTAVCPAICEEMAHRGMLLNSEMTRTNPKKAIIISSVLFGLIHLNIEQVFYAILIGLLLGYLTVMTKSIYPAMIIHFMNNAMSVLLVYSNYNNLLLGQIFARCEAILLKNVVLGIILMIILVAVLLYFLYILVNKLILNNAKSRIIANKDKIENFMKREFFFFELESIRNGTEKGVMEKTISLDSLDLDKIFVNQDELKSEDKIAKGLRFICFAMTIILTVLTFIWGII